MKTRSSTKSVSRRGGARRSSSVKLSTATRKKAGGKASRAKGRSKSSTGRASTAKPSGRTSRSARTTADHDKDDEPSGILRIDFPGFSGEQTLTEISWDRWFEIFDERGLAFLYQDTRLRNGQPSRFNKIVSRGK